ncbi:MerR family transcriptional regulator [Streptococcus porcinus]|uniref:Transcriptional regulator, MerR family n=2 Tax=Streptococcus porcinus TaxID=1340 RepID=A0A4V0HCK3_STRPO|nr:MerR family transcriptional regulator [Streptococcus porcinus]EGJ28136.1 TipAS antibiotic-recognition domain protein [Streptococcus porcinus str. Jelinkova 176]SQG44993.1 Transcriptional regulator, MerR family [Streptococcus porcinus]VTT45663.1 Transcriptional regulator, MerR family [Streptococcus porcinus]VTT47070.1 Transcriptional regulator, MerR family [Streptococcus porcinus]
MRTVKEVSQLSGVTIKTLHHYDKIGLLKPVLIKENGYRYYDNDNLHRLQEILLFRELEFPLKDIDQILNHQSYDRQEALKDQIKLLELKRVKIDKLIAHAKQMEKGEVTMTFETFEHLEYDKYQTEVKERWGATQAYREYNQKKGELTFEAIGNQMTGIFSEFAAMQELGADHEKVEAQVKKLQAYITDHFYSCTIEILAELGPLYKADQRFKDNIDKMGGPGTADFVAKAIKIYCQL